MALILSYLQPTLQMLSYRCEAMWKVGGGGSDLLDFKDGPQKQGSEKALPGLGTCQITQYYSGSVIQHFLEGEVERKEQEVNSDVDSWTENNKKEMDWIELG